MKPMYNQVWHGAFSKVRSIDNRLQTSTIFAHNSVFTQVEGPVFDQMGLLGRLVSDQVEGLDVT